MRKQLIGIVLTILALAAGYAAPAAAEPPPGQEGPSSAKVTKDGVTYYGYAYAMSPTGTAVAAYPGGDYYTWRAEFTYSITHADNTPAQEYLVQWKYWLDGMEIGTLLGSDGTLHPVQPGRSTGLRSPVLQSEELYWFTVGDHPLDAIIRIHKNYPEGIGPIEAQIWDGGWLTLIAGIF